MQQKEKLVGERGRRAEREDEEEEERGRKTSRRHGRRSKEREVSNRRAESEGGEPSQRLRWRVHRLEKDKLELTSNHNQELCRLQAELTRMRSSVERGEAQREELQYQLTVSQRDAERASQLSRDKLILTERTAELQQSVQELQKALDITRQAREEDQHALQQEVEERDRLIQSCSSENQQLHRLLQDQEAALEESDRRLAEVQRQREKEAEANLRQADELKYLSEREERSRREKEVSDQRVKSLETSIEATQAAHLESKFNSEVIQLRVRDLEAALTVERSGQQEAQCSLELLRAQFREVERAYSLERERSGGAERALERLQRELEHCRSDLSVALETKRTTTSDLTERLEEEKRQLTLLEQAVVRGRDAEEALVSCIRDTLHQHNAAGASPQAKDDGSPDEVLQLLQTTLSAWQHRLETSNKQVQDLLLASEMLHAENQALRQLTSDQSRRMEESHQVMIRQDEELARLRQECSDWSTQSRGLQAELEVEREERVAEVRRITEHHQQESEARLSFLYSVYQRLLAGCVLLDQPQSILGKFTWKELCDVINEQVDHVTSDLRKASDKIAHLQRVCEKKSVCVRQLQRSQECVLSRLEERARRREEAWTRQHTHTVTQLQDELQVCRSQCESLRGQASSLTSDLSRLRGLLSKSRRRAASFLTACALLAGTLKHSHRRLQTLCEQKALLSARLAEREALEQEVQRLAGALGGEEEEEEGGRRALRRWRRSVCALLAVGRWRELARRTTVLFRLEMGGGGPVVCVCGGSPTATQKGQDMLSAGSGDGDDDGEGPPGVCAVWLRSKWLSSIILSSMTELQGALAHTGSSPSDVMSASRRALSRLLNHLLDQSEAAACQPHGRPDEYSLSSRLRHGLSRVTSPRPSRKALVSTLQQHFLLFSQQLHSAEVERRSLRLEVANLKRGLRREREETCRTRFHSVCEELHQALGREQEAQTLIQEQTKELHTLQRQANTHTTEQTDAQHSLIQTTQSLTEARQEVTRKERSLRILGKHLSSVQQDRKQLEERLQRVEAELRDATRRKDCLISNMEAAETSYKQVRESLVQSRCSILAQPRPLPLPWEHLQLSGAESIMGAPEIAACRSLLSTFSQLYQTCCSRIDWFEQEVSALRGHVTALRSELQDVCLRDNLNYIPVSEHPDAFLSVENTQPDPLSDLFKEPPLSSSTAPSQANPAPTEQNPSPSSSPLSKPSRAKTKEKKAARKNRGGRRSTDR